MDEDTTPTTEYLVISRGQWDETAAPETIQTAIDQFYTWLDQLVTEGKMRKGQRLSHHGKTVSKKEITDGPFGESKEVVGGYWHIIAGSLEEAASIAAQNPCMQLGLFYEIRQLELIPASAYARTNETPDSKR